MSRLTRDVTTEPVSRDQILRSERGQGNIHFPCLADHVQDWQPYPVDPYSAICVTIHTYIMVTTRYSDQQGSRSRQKVMRLYKQWHRPVSKRFIKPPYYLQQSAAFNCYWNELLSRGYSSNGPKRSIRSSFGSFPPVQYLSTCPLPTNSGCGKERQILIGPW